MEDILSVNLRLRRSDHPELFDYLNGLTGWGERTAYVRKALVAYFDRNMFAGKTEQEIKEILNTVKRIEEKMDRGAPPPPEPPEENGEDGEDESLKSNLLNGLSTVEGLSDESG